MNEYEKKDTLNKIHGIDSERAGSDPESFLRGEEEAKGHKQGGAKRFVRSLMNDIILIAVVLIGVLLAEKFLFLNARIPSESMQNTIMVGNRIFGNRLAYNKEDPKRYDIVIFRYPDDEKQLFIKRVIGLPGDVIDIHDGYVYVNGSETPLTDSFCPDQGKTDMGDLAYPLTVPEGHYFMLGDNRLHSKDSRYWENSFVARDKILAKAAIRYWPINKITKLNVGNEDYYQPPAAALED